MYELKEDNFGNICAVIRFSDNAGIPMNSHNTDYQQFKIDLANGVELKDATGNVMTSQAVTEFLQGLQ